MCLFNFPNKTSIKAYNKGIVEFDCGSCPECLRKKSRLWALRCSMEAKNNIGCMVTLTYDTYKVLYGRETKEENPTDASISLSKRDCQLFIKRLRKHFSNNPYPIKYLLTAERGKRTGRAHYHALLFGIQFDDLIKYKKSDRGNWIYKSKTLEKIWQKGICTVDCINLNAKTARYCTKYCSKDAGVDDTFMLFSRGIGDDNLKKYFDGKSYWIDGREYSIPKQVWQWYIECKYDIKGYSRYSPTRKVDEIEKIIYNCITRPRSNQKSISAYLSILENRAITHERGKRRNEVYQNLRDGDKLYQRYLAYWSNKAKVNDISRPPVEERLLALPNDKYRSYKTKAILCKQKQSEHKSFMPPRSKCFAFSNERHEPYSEKSFAPLTRHYRANDTIQQKYAEEFSRLQDLRLKYLPYFGISSLFIPKNVREDMCALIFKVE